MIPVLKLELKRGFTGKGFWTAVMAGLVLTMSQLFQMWERIRRFLALQEQIGTGLSYISESAFHMSFGFDFDFSGRTLYYYLVPLLAVFPHAASYLSDRKQGYIKNILTRTEKTHYYHAKYFAIFLSGGSAVVLLHFAPPSGHQCVCSGHTAEPVDSMKPAALSLGLPPFMAT